MTYSRYGKRKRESMVKPAGDMYVLLDDKGQVILTVRLERRADGTLWSGPHPLLAGTGLDDQAKKALAERSKAGKLTPDDMARARHIGINPDGMEVLLASEYNARSRKATADAYDALPAEVKASRSMRSQVSDLRNRADRARNHDLDDDNVSRAIRLAGEADDLYRQWRETYPADARAEDAKNLLDLAGDKRRQAVDALYYDADGWLNEAARQARHDEWIAEAEALEAKAAELA